MLKKISRLLLLLMVAILLSLPPALADDSTSSDIEGLGVRCSITDGIVLWGMENYQQEKNYTLDMYIISN